MNVPKLRFGEFEDEWQKKQLMNICDMRAGKFVRASEINENFDEGLYPCFGGNGLRGFTKSFTHEGKYSLIGRQGALCGNVTLAINKFHATEHAVVVSPSEGVSTDWLFYALGKLNLNQYATGQAQPGLSIENLEKVELSISDSEKEQQKIADFLSAVDEKITALTAQKTALTQYKQGMMQRIFAQTLRFKDDNGADYPDWEKKALGEISLFITNGLALEQNQEQSGYKVTRIETISDKKINLNKVGYVETEQDISDYKLYVGDILLSNINSISHIGKVVYVDDDYDLYHGMNLLRISIMKEKHDSKFVFFQLSTPHMKQEFETKANKAVNQASINQTEIKKLILQVPSLAEQTKVAQFLTECDDKINAVDAQIQSAQQWKQGLLQQMFV